jgi:hypothetical protein
MAPAVVRHPGTRPTERMSKTVDDVILAAGDPIAHAAQIKAHEELLAAACEAMRLLQDRQQHMPEELLDGRERRVLRVLRTAIRRAS